MANLSKFAQWVQGAPVLNTNCYESFHTWEPDCNKAWMVAVPDALRFSLRTYATFYIATLLISSKGNVKKIDWKKYITSTIRSAIFLSTNLVTYLFFLCRIRHLLGFFAIPTIGYANGIVASFCSILIEKKSRRPQLALYLTNLASETLFRQLVNHGYLREIPGGTFIPFAIGLAIFKYLSASKSMPMLSSVLQEKADSANHHVVRAGEKVKKNLPKSFQEMIERLKKECSRTKHCDHEDSCAYNASKSFLHNASIGLAASSVLTLLKNLKKIRTPSAIISALLSKNNLRIPIFFGLMPLLYHSTRCTINRIPLPHLRPSPNTRDVASALVAGASMIAYPSISISMFVMWKGIEAFYAHLVETGHAKWIKNADILLYAISTGYVLGCVAYEPHSVRKGYIHFLEGLTGNRIMLFNRKHYDFYGAESSKYYGPDCIPPLNPKYVSTNFIE